MPVSEKIFTMPQNPQSQQEDEKKYLQKLS